MTGGSAGDGWRRARRRAMAFEGLEALDRFRTLSPRHPHRGDPADELIESAGGLQP